MQNSAARKLETVERQETRTTPAQVIPLRPSAWDQVRAWARKTFVAERIAEPAIVTATLLLWGWLLFSLYHALQNYTILP